MTAGKGLETAGPRVAVVLVATVCLLTLDRSASDAANQMTLLALVGTAAAAGALLPRHWLLAGSVPVLALVGAHVVYAIGLVPPAYPMHPPGVPGALTLLVLIIPAVVAARVAVALRGPGTPSRAGRR